MSDSQIYDAALKDVLISLSSAWSRSQYILVIVEQKKKNGKKLSLYVDLFVRLFSLQMGAAQWWAAVARVHLQKVSISGGLFL